ncbi:MAG: cytochrome c family protein [Rhodobacteraceae bacterium]|nr:cytochrome c family protein [Paracoccaceae bacterium]
MDSFTLNKIAGAILMALILAMGVGIVSDIIFETHVPEEPGYEIIVADSGSGDAPAAAVEIEPIAARLAFASAADGEKVAKKCAACHNFVEGAGAKTGPNLWGVVGRAPASVDGFNYSAAMAGFAETNPAWSFELLDTFLTKPSAAVPKTSMGFAGLRKPEDRAAMIAYLREQASDPVPLPEPTAEMEPQPAVVVE